MSYMAAQQHHASCRVMSYWADYRCLDFRLKPNITTMTRWMSKIYTAITKLQHANNFVIAIWLLNARCISQWLYKELRSYDEWTTDFKRESGADVLSLSISCESWVRISRSAAGPGVTKPHLCLYHDSSIVWW